MNAKIDQINAKDAAELIGCSLQTVYKLCRDGKIEYLDISEPEATRPRYIFNKSDIESYVRNVVLGKRFKAESLRRRISVEEVRDEHEENLRLKEENAELKEKYEELKNRIKFLFVEFDQYFEEG